MRCACASPESSSEARALDTASCRNCGTSRGAGVVAMAAMGVVRAWMRGCRLRHVGPAETFRRFLQRILSKVAKLLFRGCCQAHASSPGICRVCETKHTHRRLPFRNTVCTQVVPMATFAGHKAHAESLAEAAGKLAVAGSTADAISCYVQAVQALMAARNGTLRCTRPESCPKMRPLL